MSIDTVLAALDRPRAVSKNQWRARCPSCGDKNQTKLSVKDAGGGVVLMHCFGGCAVDDVIGALGLDMDDLMPPKQELGKPQRNPFTYEAIRQLGPELQVGFVLLSDLAAGRPISAKDRARAGVVAKKAAQLIQELTR